MNESAGVILRVASRNSFSGVLSVGSNLIIDPANTKFTVVQCMSGVNTALFDFNNLDMSEESNISVLNAGIFSNFADGLVFASPNARPSIAVQSGIYADRDVDNIGSVSGSHGAIDLIGSGTNFTSGSTPVQNGDIIKIGSFFYTTVQTLNTPSSITVSEPFPRDFSDVSYEILQPTIISNDWVVKEIPQLNCMHPAGRNIIAIPASNVEGRRGIILKARIVTAPDASVSGQPDLEFFTHSINSAFNGETAYFDCVFDILVTPSFFIG